jgi:hypothetical protein
MSDILPTTQSKAFWNQPGGKAGTIVPFVALAAVIWFFGGTIGDYIVNAFDNILHLLVVGLGIGAILSCVLIEDIRMRFYYAYRNLVRWITGFIIDIDPIGILKTYRERMTTKLQEMIGSMADLKGQRAKTDKRQRENTAALQNEMALLNQATKTSNPSQIGVHTKQVSRLQVKAERYEKEMNRLNLLIKIMDRYYRLCEDTITDMNNEIKFREDERAEAKASRGAVRSAMAILKGLPEQELWDEATAKLEQDYTAALGEVENFLDVTRSILTASEMQDGADAEKAMQLLDQWQTKNTNVALGSSNNQVSKATIINDAMSSAGSNTTPVVLSSGSDYLKMMR